MEKNRVAPEAQPCYLSFCECDGGLTLGRVVSRLAARESQLPLLNHHREEVMQTVTRIQIDNQCPERVRVSINVDADGNVTIVISTN